MSSFLKQLSVYVSLLAIGGGAGFLGSRYLEAQKDANSPQTLPVVLRKPAAVPLPASKSALIARGNPNFVAEVAQKVGPAVVRIDSARKIASQIPKALDNPLFRQFFG